MNILDYIDSVKPENLTKEQNLEAQRAILSELSYISFQDTNYYEVVKAETLENTYYHKLVGEGPRQFRCTFDMPTFAVENPQVKEEHSRKRKDKRKLYPEVFECSENGGNVAKMAINLLKKVSANWNYLAVWFGNIYRFFMATAKGTPAYNKKQYWRIHDACAEFDKHYKHCFFITLTLSQKEYEHDFMRAWADISEHLKKFCKKLTSRFGGKYVVVLESHKTGFPHAHMLFYTDYEFADMKYKYSKKQRCSFCYVGELRTFLDNYWTFGFSQFDKNRRKDTANYLSKYIGKFSEKDVREVLGASRVTEAEVKEILTLLLPMVAGVRAFRVSQEKFAEEKKENIAMDVSRETVEQACAPLPKVELPPLSEEEVQRAQAYLKTLCTKSPLNCANNIFSHNRGDLLKKNKLEPKEYERFSLLKNKKIAESGCRMSCKGCILSRLANLYVKNDTSLLDKKQNWFYFADLWRQRTKQDKKIENWYVQQHVTDANKQYFEMQLYKKFRKLLPREEIIPFCTALYTVDPILYPFVLPKHQALLARTFSEWATPEQDKFTQEEVLGLKALCDATFNA